MAILELPFLSVYLVQHASGGAIVHAAGGYLAGSFVSAPVVQAFATASGVLSSLSSGVVAVAANPLVLSAAVVTVAVAGAYCYFFGIPAVVAAALSEAGVAVATKAGVAVSVPQLAVALVLLGGAGYVGYRIYKDKAAAQSAATQLTTSILDQPAAEAVVGSTAWARFGAALSSGFNGAATQAAVLARDAIEAFCAASDAVAAAAANVSNSFPAGAQEAAAGARRQRRKLGDFLSGLWLPWRARRSDR
ncbi:MAG: hypothetical protein RL490_2055 [Pseudomonadota bacterium]|jgi:hypothetical protein